MFSRYLEESSYALLQVFSEKYGHFLVYGDAYDFVPRQDDFDFMQKTFNEMCFNGKLHRISRQGIDIMQKVDGMTYKQLSQKIVKRAVELGESKLDPKKYEKLFEIVAFAR